MISNTFNQDLYNQGVYNNIIKDWNKMNPANDSVTHSYSNKGQFFNIPEHLKDSLLQEK